MINYVCGFLFNENNSQVALIRKIKPEFLAGKLNGIGGKMEEHETPIEAMEREFLEETGVKLPWELWKLKLKLYSPTNYTMYVFRANSEDVQNVKTIEQEEVFVYNTQNLLLPAQNYQLVPNLKWIIPLLLDDTVKQLVTVQEG